MLRRPRLAVVLLAALVLGACVNPRSYLDPGTARVHYEDLRKSDAPLRLALSVEFQRNGEHYPKAESTLQDNVERVLRATGVIVPAADGAAGTVHVTVNNIANLADARLKGAGTGLTLGLAGNTVPDAYELSLAITANGRTVTRSAIRGEFFTVIGNGDVPGGAEVLPVNVAFSRVIEQLLLRALIDLQRTGELSSLWLASPVAGSALPLLLARAGPGPRAGVSWAATD